MINETDYTNNPLTQEQENQIDAIFAKYDTTDKPGCSVGVIQDGRFVYKKSFGMANLDYDIPITADSKFHICSIAKQFTAACIVLLKMDGKLEIDDDVRKYIPELPDYGKTITIRHLLYHTSGLRDFLQLLLDTGFSFDSYFNNDDGLKIVIKQKSLDFAPGEKHSYSNTGYLLLAEIIKRISGKTIREFADERIFKPLGMHDSYFNDDCKAVVKNKVTPYDVSGEKIHFFLHNDEEVGAGNVYSTINDFLKWDANFYDPQVGGQDFLDLMLTKGYLNNQEVLDYGFGLYHSFYKNKLTIGHTGGYTGALTNCVRFPDQKTTIIIFFNRDDIDENGLVAEIADIVLPAEMVPSQETTEQTKDRQTTYELNVAELENIAEISGQKRKS